MRKKNLLFALSALLLVSVVSCNSNNESSSNPASSSVSSSVIESSESGSSSESSTSSSSSVSTKLNELAKALTKDYSNGTFEKSLSMEGTMLGDDGQISEVSASEHEINKIISSSKYYISYENSKDTAYQVFVNISEDKVNVYDELTDGSFSNTKMSKEEWEKVLPSGDLKYSYASYYGATPDALGISVNDVEIVNDKLLVKDSIKNSIGTALLGYDDSDGFVVSSIEIEVKDELISKINVSFKFDSNERDIEGTFVVSFSEINTTTFEYPDVQEEELELGEAPDHIDLSTCNALSDEEKTLLNGIFDNDISNFTARYYHNIDDGMTVIDETDAFDGSKYFIDYYAASYYGIFSQSEKYYLSIENGAGYVYSMSDDKEIEKETITDSEDIYDLFPYSITPTDVKSSTGMSADNFVKASNGNVYCLNAEALKGDVGLSLGGESAVVSFEIELNDDNSLKEMRYILADEDLSGISYQYVSYTYSKIGTTVVTLPEENTSCLVDMSEEQQTKLEEAFNKDYSNCSIYEEICFLDLFYVDGINYAVTYDEETFEPIIITMGKNEDGTYFKLDENNNKVTIEKSDYDHIFVSFDKDKLDFSYVKYNTFTDTYYIAVEDMDDFEGFLPYYDDPSFSSLVQGIEFKISEDGYIAKINLEYLDKDNNLVTNTGFEIYDINETSEPTVEE